MENIPSCKQISCMLRQPMFELKELPGKWENQDDLDAAYQMLVQLDREFREREKLDNYLSKKEKYE